jgi:hypothetical protein
MRRMSVANPGAPTMEAFNPIKIVDDQLTKAKSHPTTKT